MKYEIEGNVLQAVINYLAKRPYQEVYEIMPVLQNSKVIEENIEKPEVSE